MSSTESWLPLAEYSMKHQVSISTLRRKIKAEDIQYRFDDGKYFVLDEVQSSQNYTGEHRPSLKSEVHQKPSYQGVNIPQNTTHESGESVLTAANRLLTDLKKAYTQVLHEKEAQIQELKQELADIKTLVKVLEFENEKLRDFNR